MKQFTYFADAGSVMVGNDDFKALYGNKYGDGEFSLFVEDFYDEINTDKYTFISVVNGKFNVYNYDCSGAEVLCELNGRYGIFANYGDIVFKKW